MPGFSWTGMNVGIKDTRPDFAVAHCVTPCAAAGVFTRNNFPGAPVLVGREHLSTGQLQTIAVNSKNANVATGQDGIANARRVCRAVGAALGVAPERVLPSSTGVIGVPLPVGKIEQACAELPGRLSADRAGLEAFARAIMTTDTRPKAVSVRVGSAVITGVAKGAGMIEPHMATMLAFFFTDAQVSSNALRDILSRVVERSFNRVSVDSDTSTSDTAVILASGQAGPVASGDFERALEEAAIYLAREIARDGEGATKLIELVVDQAPSPEAALRIAKSVINSPLVKTAIHGADPNWGRFVMAIGKVFEHPIPLDSLRIEFGAESEGLRIAAAGQNAETLARISQYLKRDEVVIRLILGQGAHQARVWGCDLTAEYVSVNADYTT
ncbi:MAG: bifunctional glutamate N-acetyltransferase/amino-acid acetyltransferase ArgJ [Deltaproteobacteria bacterium]|nr:bifunctional glutamate N-acetyltransferase/amino-acid acetyltransferase ArgJ [Deltaproteobacteria bacterium]